MKYGLAAIAFLAMASAILGIGPTWQDRPSQFLGGIILMTGYVICTYIERLAKP